MSAWGEGAKGGGGYVEVWNWLAHNWPKVPFSSFFVFCLVFTRFLHVACNSFRKHCPDIFLCNLWLQTSHPLLSLTKQSATQWIKYWGNVSWRSHIQKNWVFLLTDLCLTVDVCPPSNSSFSLLSIMAFDARLAFLMDACRLKREKINLTREPQDTCRLENLRCKSSSTWTVLSCDVASQLVWRADLILCLVQVPLVLNPIRKDKKFNYI